MPESTRSAYVARVRAYLATPEGRRAIKGMMSGLGYSYQRAVAESVCKVTRLVVLERIEEVTDEVIVAELGGVAA